MSEVKYPDVFVQLVGKDGNAFNIIGSVQKALRKAGASKDELNDFMTQAMSGDYNDLLDTVMSWVEIG